MNHLKERMVNHLRYRGIVVNEMGQIKQRLSACAQAGPVSSWLRS